jgi:hypothetical protein
MNITYTNTFSDIWRFQAVHQFRSLVFQVFSLGISALMAWSTVKNGKCVQSGSCLGLAIFSFVAVYAALITFQFLFNAIYLYSRHNKAMLTGHRVELRENGIYEETAFNQSLFFWPSISRVTTAAGFVAIYVTAHSALVIPVKAFGSAEAHQAFVRAVREKSSAA